MHNILSSCHRVILSRMLSLGILLSVADRAETRTWVDDFGINHGIALGTGCQLPLAGLGIGPPDLIRTQYLFPLRLSAGGWLLCVGETALRDKG